MTSAYEIVLESTACFYRPDTFRYQKASCHNEMVMHESCYTQACDSHCENTALPIRFSCTSST